MAFGSPITLTNNLFVNNVASGGGGAYLADSSFLIQDNTFVDNAASLGGGLMMLYSNPANVENNALIHNAAGEGAGMWFPEFLSPAIGQNDGIQSFGESQGIDFSLLNMGQPITDQGQRKSARPFSQDAVGSVVEFNIGRV